MNRFSVTRTIEAPPEKVFETVAQIENYSRAIPHILEVEILTETRKGVGTRFRETRRMHGQEATTEMEVTEFVENEKVRIVADSNGTLWDSVFRVAPAGSGTELSLVMEAKPYKVVSKMMNMMIQGVLQKALEDDLDCVKRYCEGHDI